MYSAEDRAKIATSQHFFAGLEDDALALKRYVELVEDEAEDLDGLWEPFEDYSLEWVVSSMEAMKDNLYRVFDSQPDDLVTELRKRGFYVMVLGPNDLRGYELPDGLPNLTDAQCVEVLREAGKMIDHGVMEDVWGFVGTALIDYKANGSGSDN